MGFEITFNNPVSSFEKIRNDLSNIWNSILNHKLIIKHFERYFKISNITCIEIISMLLS